MFHGEGVAGAIFLSLYSVNLGILFYGYTTRRIVFKSVYTFLFFHVVLRLSAQSVSIVIGTKSQLNVGLLIAYFVLGAEGYFSLVLCSYRFVIHHHQQAYPISGSWLEGSSHRDSKGRETDAWYIRFWRSLTAKDNKTGNKDPWVMTWIHWLMIAANTIIIVGGTRVSGANINDPDYQSRLKTAKVLRIVGQSIFLIINIFLFNFLNISRMQDRNSNGTIPRRLTKFFRVEPNHGEQDVLQNKRNLDGYNDGMHPTLKVLCLAWPPLIIRGIFGLLQGIVNPINYASIAAYKLVDNNTGITFTNTFTIVETLLAVLPEWTACCLLCTTMFTRATFNPQRIAEPKGQGQGQHSEDGEHTRY